MKGPELRARRLALGLRTTDVAESAYMSRKTVERAEWGVPITGAVAGAIARALDVNLEDYTV